MPYTIARSAGYCAGVRKAMETAFQAAREAAEQNIPCYSLGELIHNPDAVEELRRAGIRREEAIGGKNAEEYSDPTPQAAVRNIINKRRKAK